MAGGLEGLLAGRTLVKRYRIEEVIGQGGFAVVYRAEDLRLGRQCAVKVLSIPAPTPELREHLRARFEHEARAAAALPHHPNVVPVYDFGTDPETGIDFIVMELLRGENVAAYLAREGRPPLPLAMRILRDAAEGIAVGHRAGLIHRDVKPGNLFLAEPQGDQPFRVCVLDFGIARLTDEDDDGSMTRTRGAAPLSPAYASPEQLRGERSLTPATDVYALGVVGYQLLTGRKPFNAERHAGTPTELKPVRALNPQVSPELEAVIERAMRAEPAERFRDADELAGALDAAMEPDDSTTLIATSAPPIVDDERTIVPTPVRTAAPIPVAAAAAELPRAAPAPPPPQQRGKGRGWMVALPILALGGVAGVWAMSQGGDDRPDQAVRTDSVAESPAPQAEGGDAPVTAPLPVDTQSAPQAPVDEGDDTPAVTPVPFNPNADGGNPPPASQPSPVQRPSVPAQQPRPQNPQPTPQQPRPELPPQREAPRQPVPTPQPQQPQPQPEPPAPQPSVPPRVLPGSPVPQSPTPQPPPPTSYPTPRDTIVIPPAPVVPR